MVGSQLVKIEEVSKLNEQELAKLTAGMFDEIANSEEIKKILRARVQKTLREVQQTKKG